MRAAGRRLWLHVTLNGVALAGLAFLLAWLDFRRVAQGWSLQLAALVMAAVFMALGAWAGNRLSRRAGPPPPEPNAAAIAEIGISARELEVLAQLANGAPNKVIARQLGISPNTVKTHVARLFEKLGAANRTEAIARARALRIVR